MSFSQYHASDVLDMSHKQCVQLLLWILESPFLLAILIWQKSQGRSNTSQKFQRFQESDYMNPEQGLCLGALFDIAATNVRTSL